MCSGNTCSEGGSYKEALPASIDPRALKQQLQDRCLSPNKKGSSAFSGYLASAGNSGGAESATSRAQARSGSIKAKPIPPYMWLNDYMYWDVFGFSGSTYDWLLPKVSCLGRSANEKANLVHTSGFAELVACCGRGCQ